MFRFVAYGQLVQCCSVKMKQTKSLRGAENKKPSLSVSAALNNNESKNKLSNFSKSGEPADAILSSANKYCLVPSNVCNVKEEDGNQSFFSLSCLLCVYLDPY